MRRYEGAWHLERQNLFPGYVFLESEDPERLLREIEESPYLREIFAERSSLVVPEPEEELFLRKLCGREHHFGMSRGYIRDGRTFVTEGPLRGREQLIRKIDRHKRVARLRIPGQDREDQLRMWGREQGYEAAALGNRKAVLSRKGVRNPETRLGAVVTDGFRELQVGLEIVSKS
jgi:transcriptional antiterminator NusG